MVTIWFSCHAQCILPCSSLIKPGTQSRVQWKQSNMGIGIIIIQFKVPPLFPWYHNYYIFSLQRKGEEENKMLATCSQMTLQSWQLQTPMKRQMDHAKPELGFWVSPQYSEGTILGFFRIGSYMTQTTLVCSHLHQNHMIPMWFLLIGKYLTLLLSSSYLHKA